MIIGLPLYMVGCDNKVGGYCNGFNKHTALVIDNECNLASGHHTHGKTADDDEIGYNCNVHVQYTEDGKNKTCLVYRSDYDNCVPLVETWKQVKKCNKLNKKDYPLSSLHTIYINKVDGRCETQHLVQKYARIGCVFLVFAGGFIVIEILHYMIPCIMNDLCSSMFPQPVSTRSFNERPFEILKNNKYKVTSNNETTVNV